MRMLVLVAVALALVMPAAAWAQSVTVVPADQVNAMAEYLPAAIGAAVVALLARFVGPFAWVLKVARVDQIVTNHLKGVIDEFLDTNPTIRQKGVTLEVKNALIAEVANRVLAVAPGWLLAFMGGPDGVRQKIRNRLPDALKDIVGFIPIPTATVPQAAPPQA